MVSALGTKVHGLKLIAQDVAGRIKREGFFQVCLVLHIPRVAGGFFTGLSLAPWASAHIDELRSSPHTFIDVAEIRGKTIGEILADSGLVNLERMIVDCIPEAASHLVRENDACSVMSSLWLTLKDSPGQSCLSLTSSDLRVLLTNICSTSS